MQIKGVNVSKFQGDIDFDKLRQETEFVMIKATIGNGYKDANFIRNRDEARRVNLPCGFYHYAYPQFNYPQDEADWFTKSVSYKPGEVMALDFEEKYPNPVGWCKTFLDRVTSNMGFRPLLYISYSLSRSYDWSPVINANYGLWLSLLDSNSDTTDFNTTWPVVAMRQYSDKGVVAGFSPVDLNVFYGDGETFKKYGNPAPAPLVGTPDPYDELRIEMEQLKINEKAHIDQSVKTALIENDRNWQSKLDSANLALSNLQLGITDHIKLTTLLQLVRDKLFRK